MRPPHHWLIFMRREAANERVSMRSSFGNVSGLSGWPPRAAEWPTGAAGPRARSGWCAPPGRPVHRRPGRARGQAAGSCSVLLGFPKSPSGASFSRPTACLRLRLEQELEPGAFPPGRGLQVQVLRRPWSLCCAGHLLAAWGWSLSVP